MERLNLCGSSDLNSIARYIFLLMILFLLCCKKQKGNCSNKKKSKITTKCLWHRSIRRKWNYHFWKIDHTMRCVFVCVWRVFFLSFSGAKIIVVSFVAGCTTLRIVPKMHGSFAFFFSGGRNSIQRILYHFVLGFCMFSLIKLSLVSNCAN